MVERLANRLETAPDDIEGWKRLGNARRVLGELTEAEEAYGRALDLSPSDVVALEAQAQIALERSGDGSVPKITQMNYQKILELDNERMDALWYLGLAAYQESRTDEARTFWETLLNLLPPDSSDAREVKRRLGELGG
jgi:cytochrome c-type biogenesis protein CcmH